MHWLRLCDYENDKTLYLVPWIIRFAFVEDVQLMFATFVSHVLTELAFVNVTVKLLISGWPFFFGKIQLAANQDSR